MRDPAAHEPDLARKFGPGKPILIALKKPPDGLAQFRRNLLVRIQRKHPRLGGMAEGQVLLPAKTAPRMPEDFRAIRCGDPFRAILQPFVQDHHNLRSPLRDAGQQASDPPGFRPGNNAD